MTEHRSILDAIPSLGRLELPEPNLLARTLDLTNDGVISLAAAAIGEGLTQAEEISVDVVDEIATSLIDDLERLREADPAADVMVELLILAVSTFAVEALQNRGEQVRPAVWLHRGLVDPAPDGGWEARIHRLVIWQIVEERILATIAAELAARYLTTLYAHAWTHPEWDGQADHVWGLAQELLDDPDVQRNVGPRWLVHLAGHRVQWAARSGRRDARLAFAPLVELLNDPDQDRAIRRMVQSLAASTEIRLTDRRQEEWARELLAEHGNQLTPPLRLRAIAAACGGRAQDLFERLDELIHAARAHRTFDAVGEGVTERAYSRAQDAKVIAWPLRTLVQRGRLSDALRLLEAWAPSDRPGELLKRPLFMLPTSVVGTLWATRDQVAPDPDGPWPNTLFLLHDAAVATFATSFTIHSEMPIGEPHPDERVGLPRPERADEYQELAQRHLRLDELEGLRPAIAPDAAIVPWPMIEVPVQALTLRNLGLVLPLSASLRQPERCRPIGRAIVMGAGSLSSEIERESVATVLRSAGIQVEVVGEVSAATFAEAYADSDVDIIWYCSHGVRDFVRPHWSGLQFDDGSKLGLDALAALKRPPNGRRLLALNVCDAAASAMIEGSMALGIASVLAEPRQTVVSHLWPVHWIPAAAFGVLLAAALADLGDHTVAFARALEGIGSGREGVLAALGLLGPAADTIVTRVRDNELPWNAITSWGSPALVV